MQDSEKSASVNYTPNPLQGFDNGIDSVAYHTHNGIDSPLLETGGGRGLQMVVFSFTRSLLTGDGKFYVHIDQRLDGLSLVDVHAEVITAGTTGTTDIQIYNINKTSDMLLTKLTIDSGETGSDTAAAAAVIDSGHAGVTLNDVLRIDVDAVSTTPPKGLMVTLGFK